jgi:hypothetical protein
MRSSFPCLAAEWRADPHCGGGALERQLGKTGGVGAARAASTVVEQSKGRHPWFCVAVGFGVRCCKRDQGIKVVGERWRKGGVEGELTLKRHSGCSTVNINRKVGR